MTKIHNAPDNKSTTLPRYVQRKSKATSRHSRALLGAREPTKTLMDPSRGIVSRQSSPLATRQRLVGREDRRVVFRSRRRRSGRRGRRARTRVVPRRHQRRDRIGRLATSVRADLVGSELAPPGSRCGEIDRCRARHRFDGGGGSRTSFAFARFRFAGNLVLLLGLFHLTGARRPGVEEVEGRLVAALEQVVLPPAVAGLIRNVDTRREFRAR